jgi:hypothetical protein
MRNDTEIELGAFIVFLSSSGAWLVHHRPSRQNILAARSQREATEMAEFLRSLDVPWGLFERKSQAARFWSANDELFVTMEQGLASIRAKYGEVSHV